MTATDPNGQPDIERPVDLNDIREREKAQRPDEKRRDDDPGVPPPQPEPTD
ncbi:hypothetical protein AB0C07_38815 [Actinoplanes missouriensis]|uniref:hypothetical protein n=1 Tax=Actinoplanes missouriensis TaxID=1866 RepID=UPI0033FE0B42